jgi:putative oxidoreductase
VASTAIGAREDPVRARANIKPIHPVILPPIAMNHSSLEPWIPRALALLRIVTGYLFLQHGSAKLLGFPHVAMFDHLSIASLIGVAGILELVGGALILIGLFVRPVAFVLSGEMAVAYFMAHASKGTPLFPSLNQGEAAVLYCFVFLFLAVAGGGVWSVDRSRRGRAESASVSNA